MSLTRVTSSDSLSLSRSTRASSKTTTWLSVGALAAPTAGSILSIRERQLACVSTAPHRMLSQAFFYCYRGKLMTQLWMWWGESKAVDAFLYTLVLMLCRAAELWPIICARLSTDPGRDWIIKQQQEKTQAIPKLESSGREGAFCFYIQRKNQSRFGLDAFITLTLLS